MGYFYYARKTIEKQASTYQNIAPPSPPPIYSEMHFTVWRDLERALLESFMGS